MFETLTLPSFDVLALAARAVLLMGAFCVFALAFIRWRNADACSNAQLLQQLEHTFAEVRSLHETVLVMGARLEALSEKSDANTRLPPVSSAAAPRGYDIAVRLAKNGAGVEALVSNCGLTRQEAELMVRLHGKKNSEAEPLVRVARTEVTQPVRTRPAPVETRPAAAEHTGPVPVLKVQASDTRPASATRRRGSLVSAVG